MAIKTLHIVDGESTGGSLREAGLGTRKNILSWKDALYAGPVPQGLTLRSLSKLRSRFWEGKSATEFDERNVALARRADYDEVVLWFGATSTCQLSLVQLLHWFGHGSGDNTRLRLVSAYGGWLNTEPILEAYKARKPITPRQGRLARRVWNAFCAPTPRALSLLLADDLNDLPEIRDTITFLLREYPESYSGLSRLERKLLRTVDSLGFTTPAATVGTVLRTDLVGDSFLFDMLRSFVIAPHPLLRFAEPFKGAFKSYLFNGSKIAITDTGRSVLVGKADHIALNGIERWIGGVHLAGNRVRWRWDERSNGVVPQGKLN